MNGERLLFYLIFINHHCLQYSGNNIKLKLASVDALPAPAPKEGSDRAITGER
jgi:hypothetical protein